MKEKKELLPCPFCKDGEGYIMHFPLSNTYEARCNVCNIGTWPCLTREEAVAKWNSREGRNKWR